ncbi:MAG: aminotransferase class I/II-fold pyridoxal phosphate-dependent enzyme [Firmicutes bacterium]|nr:aminotransferase class I/II-fold pyridoxal phosphate-dependent enzyme [Bacillota bacterium]
MKLPIIEGLIKYKDEKNKRFHMPGHKGKNLLKDISKLIPEIDVTEVDGTDNLHDPKGIIKESEKLASKTFNSDKTYYCINGTTAGIHASIMASAKPKEKILIQRNCHRSVYNAVILGDLEPLYIYPEFDEDNNILLGVKPEDIEDKLKKHRDIKAVVITYPTYYGICCDIKKIADIVHKYEKILIVDEAHGAHLKFNERLPISAMDAGADISIQSTHKTLPAFTQSSMIHLKNKRINTKRLESLISMHQSTSPSYILMSSLDYARGYMKENGEKLLDNLLNDIMRITNELNNIKGVKVFNEKSLKNGFSLDKTKLLVSLSDLNITGKELENILRYEYNIQLEMADLYYGLFYLTVCDSKSDLERIISVLKDLSNKDNKKKIKSLVKYFKPIKEKSMKEAFYSDKKYVKLTESKGKISSDFIIPYPPGIPLVCPGEFITKDILEYIIYLIDNDIKVLGINNGNVQILI